MCQWHLYYPHFSQKRPEIFSDVRVSLALAVVSYGKYGEAYQKQIHKDIYTDPLFDKIQFEEEVSVFLKGIDVSKLDMENFTFAG